MEQKEIVRGILDIVIADDETECRKLGRQFQRALKGANPDLTDSDMAIYDQSFEAELPGLSDEVRNARIDIAVGLLSEEQLALWRSVLSVPDIELFFASLRALNPELQKTAQTIFSTSGVKAHARCSETLFAALDEQPEMAGA